MEEKNTVVESPVLTEEEVSQILDALQENVDSNEDLKVLADLPSNNEVEYHEPEDGYEVEAVVKIDPETGEKTMVGPTSLSEEDDDIYKFEDADKSIDQIFEEMGSELNNIDEDIVIEPEDIRTVMKDIDPLYDDKKYGLSDEAVLSLIETVNKRKEEGEIRFKDLHPEVQNYISIYIEKNDGCSRHDKSARANGIRNTMADLLISQYASSISIDKYVSKFNSVMESAMNDIGSEMSAYIKEYDQDKKEYLEKACANIDDEDKKKKMEQVLDSMNDGYNLTRLKNYRTRIKAYDLERPDKVFDRFLLKYKDNKYTMYDLNMVAKILNRHLKLAGYEEIAIKFLIKFCKFCLNYNVDNVEEHAFMYYTVYNIVLMDVYKAEQYDEFAPGLLKNIVDVMNTESITVAE